MKFIVEPQATTKEVRDQFMAKFPGLKIEFFRNSHDENEGSHKKDMVAEEIPLSQLEPSYQSNTLSISPSTTVSELEELFEDVNLHVQVFRKMGPNWIETTRTDSYTLKEQQELSSASRL
jgi:hypothetical protein